MVVFKHITKNFDSICIIDDSSGWFDILFNGIFIQQEPSYSMAFRAIEEQISL